MADKYIALVSGQKTEVEATVQSAGAGDAGEIVALYTDGKLHTSVLPTGVGPDTITIQASEALAAGDFVNIWDDSGTPKVRKADATTSGKEANGFVLSAVTSGNNADVYISGVNNQVSSLTGGTRYYLATTAGGLTATPPSSSGNVVQALGRASATTAIPFQPEDPVVLA